MSPLEACPKCRQCDHNCGGLAKRALTLNEFSRVPAECFIAEIDLEEEDKKLISNHKREGAHIAMIDSLLETELISIQRTVGPVDAIHYHDNEIPWVNRTMELYKWTHAGREPSAEEFEMTFALNNPRYRAGYMLLFPEMIQINPNSTPTNQEKLKMFLEKASEVAMKNIEKYNHMGACHLFRTRIRDAELNGKIYVPSYTKAIFDPKNMLTN